LMKFMKSKMVLVCHKIQIVDVCHSF